MDIFAIMTPMNTESPDTQRNIEMVRKYDKEHRVRIHRTMRWAIAAALLALCMLFVSVGAYTVGHAVGARDFRALVEGETAYIQNKHASASSSDMSLDFDPFWDAWVLLDQHFVESTNASSSYQAEYGEQGKVWGAIQGLAASYGDPFTTFMPPEEAEMFDSEISGRFSGVGMEIGNRDGYLTVISPLPGTPADKAGIQPQDIISKIDGEDSLRMSSNRAVQLIRGPRGEAVTLTILRPGESEERTIRIVRDTINIPTIETQLIDGVFVIKLFSFSAQSADMFRQALQEFAKADTPYLVLDLRGNPGGYLDAAVDMSSRFLDSEQIVVIEEQGGDRPDKVMYSEGYNHFSDELRMVILVNGGSASASEIVAGALRDHEKALVLGQQSFGKGSVQELFRLTNDTSLKITIARWLTPNGTQINEQGITPDIVLSPNEPTEGEGTYRQDYSTDSEIIQAIEIVKRPDFVSLFESIPTELQNIASSSDIIE